MQGLSGIRLGIILQAFSALITALVIAFSSSWKLAFVVICFIPLLMFMGMMQGKSQSKVGQSKDKDSFTEQGGQV